VSVGALLLTSSCAALLLAEAGVRVLHLHAPSLAPKSGSDRALWVYDATKGWFHAPHAAGVCDYGGPDQGVVRINSWGLRGAEIEGPKPAGRRRVLVFGDSFAFGVGVDEPHLFTTRLEHSLTEAGDDVEVVNMGVSGYATDQELILLEELGPQLAPDLVLLVMCDNDFEENGLDLVYQQYEKPYFGLSSAGILTLHNSPVPRFAGEQRAKLWLGEHSHLWNLVRCRHSTNTRLQGWINLLEPTLPRHETADTMLLTSALVHAFRADCERLGAQLVTLNTGHRGEHTKLFQALRVYLSNERTLYLGLEAPLGEARRSRPSGRWDFPADIHWNVDAHWLAARVVANFVFQHHLLRPRRPASTTSTGTPPS